MCRLFQFDMVTAPLYATVRLLPSAFLLAPGLLANSANEGVTRRDRRLSHFTRLSHPSRPITIPQPQIALGRVNLDTKLQCNKECLS